MPNIAVGDRILVTLVGQLLGQTTMNTYGYRCDGVTGDVSVATALTTLRTHLYADDELIETFLACTPTDFTLKEVWLQVVGPFRYVALKDTPSLSGIFDATSLTANLAGVITRHGPEANRKNIGSVHVPIGTTLDCFTNGSLTATQRTALAGHALSIVSATGTLGSGLAFSPRIPGGTTVNPWVLVEQAVVQDTVRTMRRRNKGRGI